LFDHIAKGEVNAAEAIASSIRAEEHRTVRLPDVREAGDIPGFRLSDLPPTYIPGRNGVFYSIAAAFAEEIKADYIIGGHNKQDQTVFDDAREEFFDSLQRTLWIGSKALRERRTAIVLPLKEKSKPEIISQAVSLKVPLALTWSCHREGVTHCWTCDGCLSRTRAFAAAGVRDPLTTPQEKRKQWSTRGKS
jgi:7-cyano-7-deazaguanine synthase